MTHTSGPWSSNKLQIQAENTILALCVYEDMRPMFNGGFNSPFSFNEQEAVANSLLIAAAPDLLKVLIAIKAHLEGYEEMPVWGEQIHSMVSKVINKVTPTQQNKG